MRTRGQSPGRPSLHKALCAASPRRIACLSAARRTRHDPLECPGLHAWPAAVWPLRRGRSCRSHRATTPHPHHAGEPSHLQVKGLALRLRPPPKARGEGLRCVLCGVGCLNIVTSENSRITNAAARNSSPGVRVSLSDSLSDSLCLALTRSLSRSVCLPLLLLLLATATATGPSEVAARSCLASRVDFINSS